MVQIETRLISIESQPKKIVVVVVIGVVVVVAAAVVVVRHSVGTSVALDVKHQIPK